MKQLIIIMLAASCLAITGGCTGNIAETATSVIESQGETAQSKNQESLSSLAALDGSYIGVDAAKKAALTHAGVAESDAKYAKAKLDHDDGRAIYEIKFYFGTTEYEYEIDAYSGAILSHEYDTHHHTASAGTQDNTTYIGLEKAKTIALSKINVTADQVMFTEASLDYDDGVVIYEIEFIANGMEYEFEINAGTGAIIKYDTEHQ